MPCNVKFYIKIVIGEEPERINEFMIFILAFFFPYPTPKTRKIEEVILFWELS